MLHTTAYKKKYSCKFGRYGYLHDGIFALALVMIIESTFTRKYAVTLAGNSSDPNLNNAPAYGLFIIQSFMEH